VKSFFALLAFVPACVVDGSLGKDATEPEAPNDAGVEHGEMVLGVEASVDAGSHPSCEPASIDNECTACQKHRCCDVFATCTQHVPCACVSECLAPGVSVEACETHCGVAEFPELTELLECAVSECGDPCR
jgi:hypothetical protein